MSHLTSLHLLWSYHSSPQKLSILIAHRLVAIYEPYSYFINRFLHCNLVSRLDLAGYSILSTAMAVIPTKALSYIIDHVILPPKLPPTAEDASIAQRHEQHLLRLISTRIKAYRHHRSPILPEVNRAWDVVELMIIRFATLTSTPFLMCDKVVSSLASLVSSGKTQSCVILWIESLKRT